MTDQLRELLGRAVSIVEESDDADEHEEWLREARAAVRGVRLMTIDEFRSTRATVDNLGDVLQDEVLTGNKGLMYCGALWIEDTNDWPKDAPGYGGGRWYTLIVRSEYQSDCLAAIESRLYEFACNEGYCDVVEE